MIVPINGGQTVRLMVAGATRVIIGSFIVTVNRYTSLIQGASAQGKNLIVTGLNFGRGAVLMVDGVDQKTFADDQNPTTVLIGRKTARRMDPGQTVRLQVRFADQSVSNAFMFTKP